MKNLLNVFLFSLIFCSCHLNSGRKPEILKYQIAKRQDISFMNIPRMVYRIMLEVDSLPTETKMRNTANYLWGNGNKNWKEFTVFIYLPYMNTESTAYAVGEFNNDGLVSFTKNEDALYETKWEIKKPKEPIKEISVEKLKEYRIELSTLDIGGRKLKINISTNFPDGTIFSLWINRDYYVKGDKEPNGGELGEKELSVRDGKIETIVTIDDRGWYDRYTKIAKAIPNDVPPIVKIPDKITINVMYTPANVQPENVIKILGTKGEYVTGKGAEKFGTGTAGRLTSFSVSKELYFPFKK